MLTPVVILLLLAAGAFAWHFRGRFVARPAPAGEAADRPETIQKFLPQSFEADQLEAEDLRWLLAKKKAALQNAASSDRGSLAAVQSQLQHEVEDLSWRVKQLQQRMDLWKEAVLERDALYLAHQQLRNDFLDQQYSIEALRADNEALRAEAAGLRTESIETYQEKEALRTQLNLLRNLAQEE